MEGRDWLRSLLYLAFICVFASVMYNSLGKLFERNTAFTHVQKTASALQYPSVTMCPVTTDDQMREEVADRLNQSRSDLLMHLSHSYEEGNR